MSKFNFKSEEDFTEVKDRTEKLYQTIGNVYCPYFKEKVVFNSKGWKHLRFKSNRKARSRKEQYSRFKLFYLAPKILEQSHTLQGIWQTKKFEQQKTNSRWERILKEVTYYEFVAIMDNVRTKVIIKEVMGEEKYFLSVIPFWRINKATGRRILFSNPEFD